MKSKFSLYRKLFSSTFYLSAFTFGGGFVIVPLMKKKFVDDLKWIEEEEMLNLAAIAQASPGAVAVNASILLGYRVAGISGALVTVLGTVLPPLILLSVLSFFYTAFQQNAIIQAVLKGMQAGVVAVLADVLASMGGNLLKEKNFSSILIMIGAFIATFFFHLNVIYIILICGTIGALLMLYRQKHAHSEDRL